MARVAAVVGTARRWHDSRTSDAFDTVDWNQGRAPVVRVRDVKARGKLIAALFTVDRSGREADLNESKLADRRKQTGRNYLAVGIDRCRAVRNAEAGTDRLDLAIDNDDRGVFDRALRPDRVHLAADDRRGLRESGDGKNAKSSSAVKRIIVHLLRRRRCPA